MAENTFDQKHIMTYAIIGLVVIGILAFFITQNQSGTNYQGTSPAVANAIASTTVNAQNVQGATQIANLTALQTIEQQIIQANTAIKLNAQNNATALSENNTNATLTLSQDQIESETVKQLANIQAKNQVDLANIASNTQEFTAQATANEASSVANIEANASQNIANTEADVAKNESLNQKAATEAQSKNNLWSNIVSTAGGFLSHFFNSAPSNSYTQEGQPPSVVNGVFQPYAPTFNVPLPQINVPNLPPIGSGVTNG